MERHEIVYRISADASVDGISAYEVANVMYAFADVVDEALKESGETGRLDVNVRPFKQGSFVTEFVLTYGQTAVSIFSGPECTALANILSILGFAGSTAVSLASIVRGVRGRIDRFVENGDGTFTYGVGMEAVTVGETEHKIIQSPKVAKSYKAVVLGPVLNIDRSINVTIGPRDGEPGESFSERDEEIIETYARTAVDGPPDDAEEDVVSTLSNVILMPCSGPYDGGERGYSFKFDGKVIKNVQMLDAGFRAMLESGEVRFMGRDRLIVDMENVQKISPGGKVHTSYAVIKVVDYRPYEAFHQLSIGE